MSLILFVILITVISVTTSLIITVLTNDSKLKKIVRTYGKDLEFISSCYISKVDLLKDKYEELLSYREKLIIEEKKQKKDINCNNQYLKESFLYLIDVVDEINSLEEFYKFKTNLRETSDLLIKEKF